MAARKEIGAIVEQESEIPVLTVVKNNAILKNIFLINASDSHREDSSKIRQDLEQTLLVGRHPNCQIRLDHPSISRFHLRIHTKPSLKRLSVTDLSSVHGTWISGKRVQPNVRVHVNEGDTLVIGKSSRVYRLHWIAFQKAYELNNPVNVLLIDDDKEKDEEMKMDGNALLLENEAGSTRSLQKASQVMVSNSPENSKEDKDVNVMICKNGDGKALEVECEYAADSASKVKTLTKLEHDIELVSKNEDEEAVDFTSEAPNSLPQSPDIKTLEERKVLAVAPLLEAAGDFDMQLTNLALDALIVENPLPVDLEALDKEKVIGQLEEDTESSQKDQIPFNDDGAWSFWFLSSPEMAPKSNFINVDKETQGETEDSTCCVKGDFLWSFWSGNPRPESAYLQAETQLMNEIVEPMEKLCKSGASSPNRAPEIKTFGTDNEGRLLNEATIESIKRELFTTEEEYLTPGKENYSLKSRCAINMDSDQSLSAYSNKENQTPNFTQQQKNSTQRRPLQTLFAESPQIQSITSAYSNKENQTLKKKSTQKKKTTQRLALQPLFPEKSISGGCCSNKENLTPKSVQNRKTAKGSQRMPFQPIFVDSPQKMSDNIYESVGGSMDKHKYCEGRVKRWSMVVDTNCLLDKNTRKALQLLEGIKGTHLIVPLTVVKKLEVMKQQAVGFFRRRNRDAYCASQWIEECSVRSKWWIHIDGEFGEEDEVVDYALYLRGTQNEEEEQLVILSDDVTMKIKAMAEGVICESAEEFRWSLVSPFSRRFLWAGNGPRGRTWSHLDDVTLRDHFYPSFKTAAKGLKLVLLDQLN